MELSESGDQVPRLQAFRAAHPDIDIRPPGRGRMLWTASRGGSVLATGFDLKRILDQLDRLVTP